MAVAVVSAPVRAYTTLLCARYTNSDRQQNSSDDRHHEDDSSHLSPGQSAKLGHNRQPSKDLLSERRGSETRRPSGLDRLESSDALESPRDKKSLKPAALGGRRAPAALAGREPPLGNPRGAPLAPVIRSNDPLGRVLPGTLSFCVDRLYTFLV
eukprot:8197512-Pyramimonas_sp.AAC.2